jgi:hypothetical protein
MPVPSIEKKAESLRGTYSVTLKAAKNNTLENSEPNSKIGETDTK